MDRAEWDALSAREKDAIVAEKVIGLDVRGMAFAINPEGDWSIHTNDEDPENWMCAAGKHPVYREWDHYREPPTWEESIWSDEDTPEHRTWFADELAEFNRDMERWGCHHHDLGVVPFYTTSWDAMREVVERMHADGFAWSIGEYVPGEPDAFFHAPHDGNVTNASGPSAPEAICIAALTALGHMDPTHPR